jgi:hypothetical protein
MRKAIIATILVLLCSGKVWAVGTVTVTATAQSILGSSQTVSMNVSLVDPNSTGVLRSGAIVLTNFTASSNNGTTVSIANIYGNDVITDGFGNASTSYYIIGVYTVTNGIVASNPSVLQAYQFAGSGTFDLSSTLPYALGAVSPAGSVLGQSLTFTGNNNHTGTETFASVTDSGLISGNCVQAGTAGILTTSAGPCLTGSSSAKFSGPSPWFDVTASPYNAVCDGTTPADTAVNAALAAAKAAGRSRVYFPGLCVMTGQLSLDGFQQVELFGPNAGPYAINFTGTTPSNGLQGGLKFTGNPATALILATGTFGVTIKDMFIQYTNASFTGMVVDTEHNGVGNDTQDFKFIGNAVAGTSTSTGAACGVCLDKTINSTVRDNNFLYMKSGVRGLVAGGSYSNANRVEDNMFGSGGVSMGTASILYPGQGWIITGNTFEIGNSNNTVNVIDGSAASSPCLGCEISGNWSGDAAAGWTGTILNQVGIDMSIHGNSWFTGSGVLGTVMNMQSAATGISFFSNEIGNSAVGFVFTGSNQSGINIFANDRQTVTAWMTGAPARGDITDANANTRTIYGDFRSTGSILTTPTLNSATLSLLTNGTGLQQFNTATTCTTGASVGATCTTALITLPVAYADQAYHAVCLGKGPTNVPVVIDATNSSATQFTITIAALTAAAASFSSYDCMVGHN